MAGSSTRKMNMTLALVGRTGNGKSATGNSIIGKNVFESMACPSGVTSVCQIQTTVLENGQTINVIDTPGFFDFSPHSELVGDEIIKCMDLAYDGIHALLLVFSIRTRFTKEEEAVIHNLRTLFGDSIISYGIVVFTGGDDLEESGLTLAEYLNNGCPGPLKRIILESKNECVLFNNKTKDQNVKNKQVRNLISTVETLISRNRGKPFRDELFDLQAGALKLREKAGKDATFAIQLEEQMKKVMDEVESRLKATTIRLEKQLAEAEEGRKKAEHSLQLAQNKIRYQRESDEELRILRERLRMIEQYGRDLRPTFSTPFFDITPNCSIL